jgi:carbonic anhydrase
MRLDASGDGGMGAVGARAQEMPVRTPREVWERIKAGNRLFVTWSEHGRDVTEIVRARSSLSVRQATAEGQDPYAVVFCCSDSRIVPNLMFASGVADLFTVRNAGSTPSVAATASVEFAVEALKCPLILILSHERCGAVKAATELSIDKPAPSPSLGEIMGWIRPGVLEASLTYPCGDPRCVELAADLNAHRTRACLIRNSPIIRDAFAAGRLDIVVAKYILASGEVIEVPDPRKAESSITCHDYETVRTTARTRAESYD